MVKPMDTGSLLVMAVTLILFVVALYTKGFSHDLLLEAGVFLVSVKLMLMAYKNSVTSAMPQQTPARPVAEREARRRRMDAADRLPFDGVL